MLQSPKAMPSVLSTRLDGVFLYGVVGTLKCGWIETICISAFFDMVVFCYRSSLLEVIALHWRNNRRDGVSNHRHLDCLLNRLFRCKSKKTSKLRVTGLCEGNSPVSGEFPSQMFSNTENISSNTENISVWWRHHVITPIILCCELIWIMMICKATKAEATLTVW